MTVLPPAPTYTPPLQGLPNLFTGPWIAWFQQSLYPRVGGQLGITAVNVINTPRGSITSTNVQDALNELDAEKQPLDATLTALAALSTDAGFVVQTGVDTFTKRTLVSSSGLIGITNPAGISGNTDLTLANTAVIPGTYGSQSESTVITVDQQGRITDAYDTPIAISSSAITFANQSAATFFAGPATGAAAAPTWRLIVSSDINTALLTPGPIGTTTPNLIGANSIQFNTSFALPTPVLGLTYWEADSQTISTVVDATNGVILQHGQELFVRGVNKTGAPITDGQAVYVSGAQGNRPKIWLAKADAYSTSCVIGVATQNIAINQEGFVTIMGLVHGFDTRPFAEGDLLFLSPTVAGGLTNTPPATPNYGVAVGTALNSTVNGSICIHPHRPIALDVALGGATPLDTVSPSQAAVKTYVASASTSGSAGSLKCTVTAGYVTVNGPTTTVLKTFRDADDTVLELGSVAPTVTGSWTWSAVNPMTTAAESWIGPSSTSGVYFKSGFVGIGTATPLSMLHVLQTTVAAGIQRIIKLSAQAPGTDGNGAYIQWATSATDGYGPYIAGVREAAGGKGYWGVWTGTNAQVLRLKVNDAGEIFCGGAANYTKFETDGTMQLNGDATVWEDIQFPVGSGKVPAAGFPTWGTITAPQEGYSFAVNDSIQLQTNEPLHAYKEGSDLHPHIHWKLNGAAGGTARKIQWRLDYEWWNANSTTSTAGNVVIETTTATDAVDKQNYLSSFPAISGAGMTIGAQIMLRLSRIAKSAGGSDPTGNPWASQVGIHIECDTIGSRTVTAK